jgi:hypothetical protein
MVIRTDYLFSYWIFVWFILFYATYKEGSLKNPVPSPKLAFIVAIFENIIEIILLSRVNKNHWQILKYFITIFLFKILPLYLMRDVPLVLPRDIYILIGVFLVYTIYLYAMGTSLFEVYKETNKSLEQNQNQTPFYRFLDWIGSKLF